MKLPGDTPSQAGSHPTEPILDSHLSESPVVVSWLSFHPSLLSSSPALPSLAPSLRPPLTMVESLRGEFYEKQIWLYSIQS